MALLIAAVMWLVLEVCIFGSNFNDPKLTTSEAFVYSGFWTLIITGISIWVGLWLDDLFQAPENDDPQKENNANS